MSPRVLHPACLLAVLPVYLGLASCGGSSDPAAALSAGQTALQAEDHATALDEFESVLANPASTVDQKYRAQRDLVACAARVRGAEAAQEAFVELSTIYEDRLDVLTLFKVGRELADAKCPGVAIEVITLATNEYAESEEDKKKLEMLASHADSLGLSDEQREKLKGLGYLSD